MANVIVNKKEKNSSVPFLRNGSVVIISDPMNAPVRSYLITSYRGEPYSKSNSEYCTFIDLVTGYPAFEEPASRMTDATRIFRHIYRGKCIHTEAKPKVEANQLKVIYPDRLTIKIEYDE